MADLVAVRADLLRDMGFAILHVPDERRRDRFGRLAVAGLLDCAAGTGPRRSALVLLLRHLLDIRVPSRSAGCDSRGVLPGRRKMAQVVYDVVYYRTRWDPFGCFMVFWAVGTFTMYTIASEKMPWLLVNITLPLAIISGKFLGDLVQKIEWRRLASGGGLLLAPGIPLLLALLWRLAFYDLGDGSVAAIAVALLPAAGVLALAVVGYYLAPRCGVSNFRGLRRPAGCGEPACADAARRISGELPATATSRWRCWSIPRPRPTSLTSSTKSNRLPAP